MIHGMVTIQKGSQVKTLLLNDGSGQSVNLSGPPDNTGFNVSAGGGMPPVMPYMAPSLPAQGVR
jgi:hypothetical protein